MECELIFRWWPVLLLFFTISGRAQNVSFSVPAVSCNNGSAQQIKCDHDAHDVGGHIEMTEDSIHGSPVSSTGYVFYGNRVKMLDVRTGRAASFSTSFTFRITTSPPNTSGDGISFVMFANETFRGNSGGTLGVYIRKDLTYLPGTEGTKTFCVEFDTFLNPGLDPSDNHVGVDLENVTSKITEEAGSVGIYLKGGYPVTSWIDYDFARLNLEVRIANASESAAKPAAALLSYALDLSKVVEEFMSVGIAASTGGSVEFHELYNWSFVTYGLPSASSSGKSYKGLIAGIAVGAVLVLLSGLGCCSALWMLKGKRSEILTGEDQQYEMSAVDMPFRFTYKQLSVATNGFSEMSKLGQGGSSSVYRGEIASTGMAVAVKRVANRAKQGEREFLAEIRVVSRLRHRNLVKLLGWCADRGQYLMVYELMPNGSLDKLLYDDSGDTEVLMWPQRMAIVRGVAAALAYLHEGYVQQVIHRDIKSSNVMLDEHYSARVGDFGLARLIEHSKNLATTQLAGTVGYIAPEAVLTWKSTDKTDVYAFGALALEIATARRPIDNNAPPEEMILVDWVWHCYAEGVILRVADARLARNFLESEMKLVLLTGLLCSNPDPLARPSMREVELYLEQRLPLPPVPLHKPVPVYSSTHALRKEMMAGAVPSSPTSGGSFFTSSSSNNSSTKLISF